MCVEPVQMSRLAIDKLNPNSDEVWMTQVQGYF